MQKAGFLMMQLTAGLHCLPMSQVLNSVVVQAGLCLAWLQII